MSDPFDLQRFVAAQAPVIDDVRAELRAGRKRTHWMWFVFPQFAGLGSSSMARRYAIGSREEAKAYLAHPVLGPRLVECTSLLLALPDGTDISRVMGSPDDVKLRSCMTLFDQSATSEDCFGACLKKYFGGEPDPKTLALLAG